MNYRLRTLQILIALVCGVFLGLHFWDFVWSKSADLAHHYVLVERLAESGDLPRVADPSLGEMQLYPRLSHQIAADLGRSRGSPLAGMQIVVLFSMIALWSAIGWMIWSQPAPQARRATLIALLALVIGGLFLRLDLWGREIVGNYFYAQFVAQAASLTILAIALSLSQAGWSRFTIYGLLIVGIFVVELVHLLPAVELLGFLGLLVLCDQLQQSRRWPMRGLAISAIFPIVALLVVVVNPVFKAMASISENDGILYLAFIPNHFALQVLVLVTAASSILSMWYWFRLKDPQQQREQLVIKYFATLGLSISTLCLLQMVALEIGHGSEYACRKYAFGLWTVLLVNVSLLLAYHSKTNSESGPNSLLARTVFDCCAVGLLTGVAALTIFPARKTVSLSGLMSMERRLEAIKAHAPAVPPGTSTYAIKLPGESPVVDYMFSLGVFKAARSVNTLDILRGEELSLADKIGVIVTGKNQSLYDIPACRLPSDDPAFSLIAGSCYAKSPVRKLCLGEMHATEVRLSQGFSVPEGGGTWTDAKVAVFHCEMPDHAADYPESVRISGFAFVPAAHIQHVAISVNGGEARELVFDHAGQEQSVVLPVPKGASAIQIKFLLPDAVSPSAAGVSGDPRELGLFVQSVQLLNGNGRPM